MSYPAGEIIKNFLSVCFGVCAAIAVVYFFFLSLSFLSARINSDLFEFFLIGVSAFAGGFSTSMLATRHKLILAFVTSLTLIVLYIKGFNIGALKPYYAEEIKTLIIIFLASIIGGIVGTNERLFNSGRNSPS